VERALGENPIESARCAEAARAVLPIARERSEGAEAVVILPRVGRFVVPRNVTPTPRWFHHVSVIVEAHHVDALTGPDGCPAPEYLARHFLYPTYLREDSVDLARGDL
jgi:hypothetical protein